MAGAPPPPYEISNAVNDNDHGPVIIAVASVLLVFSTLVLILRLWMRWPWKSLVGADDACTCIAQAFSMAQTCAVLAAVPAGLGKRSRSLDVEQEAEVKRLIYASDLLFVISTWLSRLAVALLFIRLCGNRLQTRRIYGVVYAVAAFMLASLLVVAIREDPTNPLASSLVTSTYHRWIAVGALGMAIELLLTGLSVFLVWGLQMQPKDKLRVISGFAARMTIAAPIAIRLVSLKNHIDAEDVAWAFVMPALWAQLEQHMSVIGATIPCLRIFLKSFSTGYFGMTVEQLDPTGTVLATKGGSYNLSNLRSGGSDSNPTQAQVSKAGKTTSRVTHTRDDESLSERSDRGIFVRQTVNVAYGN